MGIKEVIAEYSTPMAGRNGNQSFNVNKSANTLSGVIVAPDETFSFNGRVGVTDLCTWLQICGSIFTR